MDDFTNELEALKKENAEKTTNFIRTVCLSQNA